MNKIIDCFTFYNELKILGFRLKELNDVVDYFVLAEATLTHSGQPKELIYQNNKHLFEEYNHKIIHVIVDDMPADVSHMAKAWDREIHQRDCLIRGIEQLNIEDTDIVLISDCDEIPKIELLEQIKIHGLNIYKDSKNLKFIRGEERNHETAGIVGLNQELFYYNLECKFNGVWWQSKIMTYNKLKEIGSCNTARRSTTLEYYENAGWHFSYFGNADYVINKIKNFAHQEFNLEENLVKEIIEERIKNNKDPYGRKEINFTHYPIELNNNLPINYKMLS
jgi:beta-1,4-mannosyl-glycoprotein beta-1,4-N-acetylglucosaminyltransferase